METIIKNCIQSAIEGAEVVVLDPRNDGIHLEAVVVSEKFTGLPLFKQHQMVMKSLKDQFETGLHALGLKTFTPKEWENAQNN
jgi:stress-induced morphogen